MEDIYNHSAKMKSRLKRYESSEDPNIRTIADFARSMMAYGTSPSRISKYMMHLAKVSERLDVPFADATKDDLTSLVADLNTSSYKENTKQAYKVIVKRFWKWLKGYTEGYPDEVRWIKTTTRNRSAVSVKKEDLLTADEIKSIVESCVNVRYKAMVMTMYEGGLRDSELLTMRLRNVKFDEQGAYLSVTGKTGDKIVFVYLAAPLISQWVSQHPENGSLDAPLFPSLNPRNYLGMMTAVRLSAIVKSAAARAGITRRVWPYLLRHSAATEDATIFSHSVLTAKYGWTAGSKTPSVYVHLGAADIKTAQLGKYGIHTSQQTQRQELFSCPRCKQESSPGFRYCPHCGLCIDKRLASEIQQKGGEKKESVADLRKEVEELREKLYDVITSHTNSNK